MTQGILNNPLLHRPWAIIINHRCFGDGGGAMRSIVLVGLLTLLIGVAQAQDVGEVQSKAEFVVGSAGECRFNFAITYHNKTITGAVAWTEEGPVLRVPPETFGMIDGKPAGDAAAMFGAVILHKRVALGLYDGTILPIDLLCLNLRRVADCAWARYHPDLPAQ